MENRIADQIRFYRKQKGLTQEQLAEAMGVSVAAVSKWEQGQSLPEIPMLMELADFFDLSVDALLGYRLRANDRKSIVERMKRLRREDNYDEALPRRKRRCKNSQTPSVSSTNAPSFLRWQVSSVRTKRCRAVRSTCYRTRSACFRKTVTRRSAKCRSGSTWRTCCSTWRTGNARSRSSRRTTPAACSTIRSAAWLAGVKERREEGVPYLSMALLRAVTSLVRVCDGFANVYEARGDFRSAIDILQWKHSMLTGLRKGDSVSELDKISAASHAALARLEYNSGDLDGAREALSYAKALAAAYDASPSHSAENVRFYEGMETVGIYSDFSRSALDAAFHAFIDDGGTSEHESFWKSVT